MGLRFCGREICAMKKALAYIQERAFMLTDNTSSAI
jgi:hypothetical protein